MYLSRPLTAPQMRAKRMGALLMASKKQLPNRVVAMKMLRELIKVTATMMQMMMNPLSKHQVLRRTHLMEMIQMNPKKKKNI